MSARACKEIIDEDLRAALEELARQTRSFESLFDALDAAGEAGAFYEEAIAIDREVDQAVGKAVKAYKVLRLKAAEAV
jgi:hypothetical protein